MKKYPRVLIAFNTIEPVKENADYTSQLDDKDWQTEKDIINAIKDNGYPYALCGLYDSIDPLLSAITAFKPDIVFNLVERFPYDTANDHNIISLLDLLGVRYTGCDPKGLMLCKDKGLSKKLLSFHRIEVPEFTTLLRGKKIRRPKRLEFPIFIKPIGEEASRGIAQSSFVDNDQQFTERVQYIHEKLDLDAIAEEYIEGRELYISVLGNERVEVFPVRELKFRDVPDDEPKFASYRAKWDENYRKRWGIKSEFSDPLPAGVKEKITKVGKKIYKLLAIRGYARLDMRLKPDGKLVFIEANPNPMIALEEDFAGSANKGGYEYRDLIKKIIDLGLKAPTA
ncbi:MAG: D-alanine-D-alanine ligase [Candidatus Omnitrophota bacterium]|jgi:D-alanine-D-alanine ligase